MKTTYRLIENPPYDKDAPNTFWIKKEVKLFGFIFSSRVFGDYEMDDSFGKLGMMPFFDRYSAEARLKLLNRNL